MEFEKIVKTNMKKGYFAALTFVGSHDDAIELSQQAFVKAYKNFKKFDKTKNFFVWYYTILKNLCLNYLRDNKKKISIDLIINKKDETDYANPQKLIEQKELVIQVEKAISELNIEDREIIMLREFEGFSYKEIAEILQLPEGTVMSRLFYARKKLAKKLKSYLK